VIELLQSAKDGTEQRMSNSMMLVTDIGHDPDDVIALSYLIEHGVTPSCIIVSPGFDQQIKIAGAIILSYGVQLGVQIKSASKKENPNYHPGKHKLFKSEWGSQGSLDWEFLRSITDDSALIIGPAKNCGKKLIFNRMVFQGGYSANSIKPLDKFKNVDSMQSFNPCGAKKDFNLLLENQQIKEKRYVGKNVCHGYTKEILQREWEPENSLVKSFWDQLKPTKAMHDVLAAKCFLNHDVGVWEQAKPAWDGNKMYTVPTDDETFTLIGLRDD
jgi:hypothetical protein